MDRIFQVPIWSVFVGTLFLALVSVEVGYRWAGKRQDRRDLEKEAPIMSDPASYGIRRIMRPSSEDLSLGYFYEVQEGMDPEHAERVYQQVYETISGVVDELPFNYSMADGLLYISRSKTSTVAAR